MGNNRQPKCTQVISNDKMARRKKNPQNIAMDKMYLDTLHNYYDKLGITPHSALYSFRFLLFNRLIFTGLLQIKGRVHKSEISRKVGQEL